LRLLYSYLCIMIVVATGCAAHHSTLGESQVKIQLLADLFRSMGGTYKEESYGFDMTDVDFANLQALFEKIPPAFHYRQESRPIGKETVIAVESVLMHDQIAHVILRFISRDAFYKIEYTLRANAGGWKIVDKKMLMAT
jgi:hypothetical protein